MKRFPFIKPLSIVIAFLMIFVAGRAQERINMNDIKFDVSTYIFYGRPILTKANILGAELTDDEYAVVAPKLYSTFTVHKKLTDTSYIIQFREWNVQKGLFESKTKHQENLTNAMKFNHVAPEGTTNRLNAAKETNKATDVVVALGDEAFFIISERELADYAYIYEPRPNWEFIYGTISHIARMRGKVGDIPGRWSTDLNLGITVGIRRNIGRKNNIGLSGLIGVAITKVNLDSIGTKGAIQSSSEKPAFTPSLNILFSYQNFSLGGGIGMDWINEDSREAFEWIYNKRIFYSISFGINIFRTSSNESARSIQSQ